MNKAKLLLSEYKDYLTHVDTGLFCKEYQDYFYSRWNETDVKKIDSLYKNIFKIDPFDSEAKTYVDFSIFKSVETVNSYIELNDFLWNLEIKVDKYCIITYGKISLFVIDDFIEIIEAPDYSNYTPIEVKQLLLDNNTSQSTSLTSNSNISINTVYKNHNNITSKMDFLKQELENIKNNKNEELATIQKEIDEKMAVLNKRKSEMMLELNEKMAEFQTKLDELKKQIFMLKTEIYSIRCFAGETVELIQLRNGQNSKDETPVVLNQKILYLDEDLAKTLSIYSDDIAANYKLLEEAIKYNDIVLEMFCPQEKSISFFKCSKTNRNYYYDYSDNMLSSYNMLHGDKIGFVVRNNENVYIGWLEEEWDNDKTDRDSHILTFTDSVIYKPSVTYHSEDEPIPIEQTNADYAISRYFAISVLQGLIEHKHFINLPETVNIMKPSKYVIHNYADGWLEDNRYGTFSNLVENLNDYKMVGNKLLVITPARESNQNPYRAERSNGERNTTRDCHVKSGFYDINLIKDDEVYISVSKSEYYTEYVNKANFKLEAYEYIDLTFMNSIWLKYFIDTKKIGGFGKYRDSRGFTRSNLDYAYLIKYFKMAYDYLIERELSEREILKKVCSEIDTYNWIECLSHWKILNKVRFIKTEHTAKRFINYLKSGVKYQVKYLFDSPYKEPTAPNLAFDYFETAIGRGFSVRPKYLCSDKNSIYGFKDDELVDKRFDGNTPVEEIIEREEFDKEKIAKLRKAVFDYAAENNVSIYDSYFRKLFVDIKNNEKLKAYLPTTLDYIYDNILMNDCSYVITSSTVKADLTNHLNSTRLGGLSSKLYHLFYLTLLQREVYPFILKCVQKTIKYNYKYEKC